MKELVFPEHPGFVLITQKTATEEKSSNIKMGVCRKLETSDITKRSVTNLGDRLDVVHVMDLVYGQNFTAKSKLKSFSFRLDVFVLMVTPDSNTAKSVSVSASEQLAQIRLNQL